VALEEPDHTRVVWAADITRLTWSDDALFETTSHAIALDFPNCCRRN
jgi:hypothetical protein